ncbi:MAG: ASKHA domain-containing protein [Candidatus Promineifilaceae bacterium]|nr:ASKHA domain-containing protein [Candidatus Promineifilaceae bacterium]
MVGGPPTIRLFTMADHIVTFDVSDKSVRVATGTLLSEAAQLAGIDLNQPCGGQGRCGRCAVRITEGSVRRRSTLRLSAEDVAQGYALACQAVVEGDVNVSVPPQEQVERRMTTDLTVAEVMVPEGYDPAVAQSLRRYPLTLSPPSMDDQTDDWSRLQTALRQEAGVDDVHVSLPLLRRVGPLLRQGEWQVTVVVDGGEEGTSARLVQLLPGHAPAGDSLWGAAVDIGTTTVTVWLVDLQSGRVHAQVAEYNRQIARGEDVISRIVYAGKNEGGEKLRALVLESINLLLQRACRRVDVAPEAVLKATVAGNTTMMHLLLGVPPESIRLSPFIPVVNRPLPLRAEEVGLAINPEASVDCLPGVASYVGADISAGVLASGMDDDDTVSLFMDIGTNGETALGSRDWLVACACSAGPAFEGAGVLHGMRATAGAIEEVWVNGKTYEPTCRVIGDRRPRGLCGSGLISLLAELFLAGVVDRGGHFNADLPTDRVRQGEHGLEYVVAWPDETENGEAIVLTRVDVDNLLRAKAAIYAGFTVLADAVGLPLEAVERVLIGGAFGKYINVEKAVEIGLLPDIPWERFHFLGNTSVRGAYLALLDRHQRVRVSDIAARMTYVELSADNAFYDAFTSALFLPHTDLNRFPSVRDKLDGGREETLLAEGVAGS